MNLSAELLGRLASDHGDSFYLLDTRRFERNYRELLDAFRAVYRDATIAYSYKTNYTPRLCKAVDALGGLAEIVSGMEYEVASQCGVADRRIMFNGPCKDRESFEKVLVGGGVVNLDSEWDISLLKAVATHHHDKTLRVGIRCNFPVGDGLISRFGFDAAPERLDPIVTLVRGIRNVQLAGLHCHFPSRRLETWPSRASVMLRLADRYFEESPPQFVALGGGLFGKMGESLKAQFGSSIPTFAEYAAAVATQFEARYGAESGRRPTLILEPGTALAGDAMRFVTRVRSIKTIGAKSIATVLGSVYNINPTLNNKNPPLTVYRLKSAGAPLPPVRDVDIAGFTCIESDYLYRGYTGELTVGDFLVFENVGSYSVVLKPPFILPNVPMVELDGDTGEISLGKRAETFQDVFRTFTF